MAIGYGIAKKQVYGKELYYAHAKQTGVVDMDELCNRISMRCSLKKSLLYAAIIAFSEAMEDGLADGKIVDLGSIGRFRVSFGSKGVGSERDFCTSKHIHAAKIVYFPGKELRQGLRSLEFKKV